VLTACFNSVYFKENSEPCVFYSESPSIDIHL
jgi:hypothetical protein